MADKNDELIVPNEPTYILETTDGETIEVTQSEYIETIDPLQAELEAYTNEQGLPPIDQNLFPSAAKGANQELDRCNPAHLGNLFEGEIVPRTTVITGTYLTIGGTRTDSLSHRRLGE